jgi:hypothetical protein
VGAEAVGEDLGVAFEPAIDPDAAPELVRDRPGRLERSDE